MTCSPAQDRDGLAQEKNQLNKSHPGSLKKTAEYVYIQLRIYIYMYPCKHMLNNIKENMSGFLHFKFSHFCAIKSLCDCVRLVRGVGRCKFLFMGARSCDTGVVNVHIFFLYAQKLMKMTPININPLEWMLRRRLHIFSGEQ